MAFSVIDTDASVLRRATPAASRQRDAGTPAFTIPQGEPDVPQPRPTVPGARAGSPQLAPASSGQHTIPDAGGGIAGPTSKNVGEAGPVSAKAAIDQGGSAAPQTETPATGSDAFSPDRSQTMADRMAVSDAPSPTIPTTGSTVPVSDSAAPAGQVRGMDKPRPAPEAAPAQTRAAGAPSAEGQVPVAAVPVEAGSAQASSTIAAGASKETEDSAKEETSDRDSDTAEGPPLPIPMLPGLVALPIPAPNLPFAGAGTPSGEAAPAAQAVSAAGGAPTAPQGLTGLQPGAPDQAKGAAETPLALRVQPRAGRGDAEASGDRASAKSDGDFSAALAASPDAAASPDPSKLLAPPSASAPTAAPATPALSAPAEARPPLPVPLGAVPMTIGLRALAGSNQFEIRLDPKDLGRIDVNLAIDKDTGSVQATLKVDRPETLALLQRDAGSLQQALSQAGLNAPDGSISLSLRSDGGGNGASNGSGANEQRAGGQGRDHGKDTPEITIPPSAVPLRLYGGGRGLDIRI